MCALLAFALKCARAGDFLEKRNPRACVLLRDIVRSPCLFARVFSCVCCLRVRTACACMRACQACTPSPCSLPHSRARSCLANVHSRLAVRAEAAHAQTMAFRALAAIVALRCRGCRSLVVYCCTVYSSFARLAAL